MDTSAHPNLVGILLLVIGVIGVAAIFLLSWIKNRKSLGIRTSPKPTCRAAATPLRQKPPAAWTDLARAALILLSVTVAAGWGLVLLPNRSFDTYVQQLQSRRTAAREPIALLYLGDETIPGKETTGDFFRIRCVIRNISTETLERLDALVSLYDREGIRLETVLVRMDKNSVPPDDLARLELTLPHEGMKFASYSVAFKLRGGETVAYKDMRQASTGK